GLCRYEHDVRGGRATHERDRHLACAWVWPDQYSDGVSAGVDRDRFDRCGDWDSAGAAVEFCFDRDFELGNVQRDRVQLPRDARFDDLCVSVRRDYRLRRFAVAVNSRLALQDRRRVTCVKGISAYLCVQERHETQRSQRYAEGRRENTW